MTAACPWCELVACASGVLYETETFLLIEPVTAPCSASDVAFVPRAHVAVLTELDSPAMAAVLAGLSRLSSVVSATERLAITTHLDTDCGHVHFHPTITPRGLVGNVVTSIHRPRAEPLAEAMVAVLRNSP